jgi:hypothetical protein
MGRPSIQSNPRLHAIFDDLEQYLDFCKSYGYRYDERDLYNWRSYPYQQFNKHLQNKPAKDMWSIDSSRRR